MEVSLPCDVFSVLLDMKMVPGHLAECLRSALFLKKKTNKHFDCAGPLTVQALHCCMWAFSSCSEQGLLSSCSGFSYFEIQALRHMASVAAGSPGDVDHGDVQSSQQRSWEQKS